MREIDIFVKKVFRYMQEQNMLNNGDTCIAGVSGGQDSLCLLHILTELRQKMDFRLIAVYIDHNLRRESREDGEFVRDICCKWGCEYVYKRVDVKGYAKETGLSTEEAGRQLRYHAFEKVGKLMKVSPNTIKIATAHHMDDMAETVLLNLFRGSGLKGLTGIPAVREDIIRPLLCLKREEIEEYIRLLGCGFRHDVTNDGDAYTRNRVRHHVIPYCKESISRGIVEHICQSAAILRDAWSFVRNETMKACDRCILENERGLVLNLDSFFTEDPYMQSLVLFEALEKTCGRRKDLSYVHIGSILKLIESKKNGSLDLPYGMKVQKEYDYLVFRSTEMAASDNMEQTTESEILIGEILKAGEGSIELGDGSRAKIRLYSGKDNLHIAKYLYTKFFDYDKIKKYAKEGEVVFRRRRPGDYLMLKQDGQKKSLGRLMIDAKIPPSLRDSIIVLAQGSHVLWVPGYRESSYYHISEDTQEIMEVTIIGANTAKATSVK